MGVKSLTLSYNIGELFIDMFIFWNTLSIMEQVEHEGVLKQDTHLGDNCPVSSGPGKIHWKQNSPLAAKYSSSLWAAPCQVERGTSYISLAFDIWTFGHNI